MPSAGTDNNADTAVHGDASSGRVPTQRRSVERREALLRAALLLLAEGGPRAVTHRAVAARAGLPLAATTYYFDSIAALTVEALRLHSTERVAELRALADDAAQRATSRQDLARRIVDSLLSRDTVAIVAQFEVYLEAARNPKLRPAVAESLEAFEALAASLLASAGAREPADAAAAFVALVNGFALHRVARDATPRADAEALMNAMRALLIAQLMPVTQLDRWNSVLDKPF
ncbi:TetR/AcrR family transcriptional regulator [Fodinicola acaciae]|uniref:TetR/AcrR family transcriptional regulator n=1 Tax=Fodinicola acaciae TaxID=2681555 RepID=UPI0013D13F27|nr:TetR family transcriptional regulator [Fodinicola acaciae]